MKFCIKKEIQRSGFIIKKLFKNKEFDFNREDSLNYALFHEHGLFSKTEAIKKLIRDFRKGREILSNTNPSVMLDIGCGTGEIDQEIQHEFCKVIGIDYSMQAVKKARERKLVNCDFLVCNADKLCFLNNLFDTVILVNCLHHSFQSIRVIIHEAFRILKKGGFMVIFELNPLNPLQIIWFHLFSPVDMNMRMISPERLKKLLKGLAGKNKIMIRQLSTSLYFEYMAVCIKE